MKTITLHSYPFYVADWVRSETRAKLSSAGRNIFRELLDYCWIEGDLPTDEDALMAIAGATRAEFSKCWPQISTKFTLQDGRYHHWKVDVERPRLISWRESRKNAGKIGGKASAQSRAEAKNSSSTASSTASSDAEATSKPSSSSSSSSSIVSTPIFPALDPAAADFHQTPEYWSEKLREIHPKPSPRRLVEQFCVDHWLKCGDAAKYAAFMLTVSGSLTQWCEAWARNGNRFAPSLDKWLHDESYRKQPPAPESEFDNTDPFARRPQ